MSRADVRCSLLKSRFDSRVSRQRDIYKSVNFVHRIMLNARAAVLPKPRKQSLFRWMGRGGWSRLKPPPIFIPNPVPALAAA